MEPMAHKTMHPAQEFGPCLREILKEKKVSASELARMMNYKSRNSIFRILCGKGGHGTRQAFCARLMREDPLSLDDAQRERLERALEISRVGMKAYLDNQAMRELLMDGRTHPAQGTVRVDAADYYPQDPDFSKAVEGIDRAKKVYLTILGCCDRAIFGALRERICCVDAHCEVRIVHLLYTGPEEIVRNIAAIQPLLYCDFYNAYCMEPGIFSRERECVYRSNCIYAHVQDEHGDWYDRRLMLIDKGVFVPMRRMAAVEHDPIKALFDQDLARTPPLKTRLGMGTAVGDYLAYTEGCRRLEQNRAVYTIKLDVPVSFVHPDILAACIREDLPQEASAMADLEHIHRQRFENFMTKKKVNHTIFSREAMERFARTGRQSDHFFALRSYTPGERVRILQNLREQETGNPYFHVHFFTDDFEPPASEVALYEGMGTLMAKPYTDYDLSGEHAEAIIAQEEFCARYKEFFLHDLLERHVISREETLAVLDDLIEMAKSA
ncbi:MAG: hypothetical protein ACI4MP_11700 [Candidatus Ventricola sp.]